MPYYWTSFSDGQSGTISAPDIESAMAIAKKLERGTPIVRGTLPYPASPVLHRREDDPPAFCFTPDKCLGHGACRREFACDD